jgi:hypothetical protein
MMRNVREVAPDKAVNLANGTNMVASKARAGLRVEGRMGMTMMTSVPEVGLGKGVNLASASTAAAVPVGPAEVMMMTNDPAVVPGVVEVTMMRKNTPEVLRVDVGPDR